MLWLICLFFVHNCPTVVSPLHLDLFIHDSYTICVYMMRIMKNKRIFFFFNGTLLHYEPIMFKDLLENALVINKKIMITIRHMNVTKFNFVKEAIELWIMSNTVHSCAFLSFLQTGSGFLSLLLCVIWSNYDFFVYQ